MIIVNHRNIFFAITGLLVVTSIAAILMYGLKLGIDFTGGTLAEVHYATTTPTTVQLTDTVKNIGLVDFSVRPVAATAQSVSGYIIRAGTMTEAMRTALPQALSVNGAFTPTIDRITEVGPTIGKELRNKAIAAISLVLFAILLFIAFAFRKVSRPVSSWVYGSIALITLVHDVIVPVGFFAALGHFAGAQADTLFVTAILTILGYSIHNTIVVFDRVRENLRISHGHNRHDGFPEIVGRSLNQTIIRSVNTSVTVLISLTALYVVGPVATQNFALVLIVGVIAGTYSSVCIAAPLLIVIEQWRTRRA